MHAGLIHYQQNLGCDAATYTISYNNEDPGTQVALCYVLENCRAVHLVFNRTRDMLLTGVCSCRWLGQRWRSCPSLELRSACSQTWPTRQSGACQFPHLWMPATQHVLPAATLRRGPQL